ncbi:MAG: MBL fold metallo-hydrolase, partial [Candidatus Latescibacter sp.]|nr:MBL fold metallo-hydrolase [Candidatus Latescibacter sp.]
MNRNINFNLNYDQPIKIADDVYWVGFYDMELNLHCNPYLIIDNGEAVLIDSGSRPDFPTVLMKILQTGISPNQIKALIYHHYDPDLCGNIPSFEDIIGADNLQLISAKENMPYIRHYSVSFPLITLEESGFRYSFTSG